PNSCKPRTNAATCAGDSASSAARYIRAPMRRTRSACCARAPSGQAAAAPPSATSNSRRPMVTVIRPSRARCVDGTVPRHERAVLTARHPARMGRLDFERFIFGRAVGRALITVGIGRMAALGANRTHQDGGNDMKADIGQPPDPLYSGFHPEVSWFNPLRYPL